MSAALRTGLLILVGLTAIVLQEISTSWVVLGLALLLTGVLVRGLEWDKPMDHPAHYPIFAEAERLGLPMVVHLGLGSPTMFQMFDGLVHPAAEKKTFDPPYSRRLLSTLTVQYGFFNLMEGSLLDDFPKLRWAFLEGGGCTWMAAEPAWRCGCGMIWPRVSRSRPTIITAE